MQPNFNPNEVMADQLLRYVLWAFLTGVGLLPAAYLHAKWSRKR